MKITFEPKDLPIKTVTIKGKPHLRALIADDIKCIIEKGN